MYAFLWIVSLVFLGLIVFGEYGTTSRKNPMDNNTRILYYSFSRIVWGLAMSFIVYACVSKYGGFVNQILSLPFWVPLSKLSFCAYLIQFSIIQIYVYSQDHAIHLEVSNFVTIDFHFLFSFCAHSQNSKNIHLKKIYLGVGNVVFTYLAAWVCTLIFELPFVGLEKFIFK